MEKISSGNLYAFETKRPKHMKIFHFPQEMISPRIRDPHSKALEPDCLCPRASDYDTAPKGRRRPSGDGWVVKEVLERNRLTNKFMRRYPCRASCE